MPSPDSRPHDKESTSTTTASSLWTAADGNTNKKLSPVKLHNQSWFDDIELEEAKENCAAQSNIAAAMEASSAAAAQRQPQIDESLADCHVATPVKAERPDAGSGSDERRQIAVEFLDVSNEQKYDRLLADDKIKNPIKRRLSANSNESRSSSPPSMPATDELLLQTERDAATVDDHHHNHHLHQSNNSGNHNNSNGGGRKNVPKKSRYEHQSQSSLSSGGTSTSTAGPRGRFNEQHRKRHNSQQQSIEYETCQETLARRQKQIDYGKNTVGYDMYVQQVPRAERTKEHPWTPPKCNKYSRRAWDGLVKVWRKKLHCWDPESMQTTDAKAEDDSDDADECATDDEAASDDVGVKGEPKTEEGQSNSP